jgi:SAM-dependent methyltransferase
MITLICPYDFQDLQERPANMTCPHCSRQYQIIDEVVCLLDKPDDFYEGAYENQTRYLPRSEKPWHVWPLWLINSGYVWAVRKYVPHGARVVELGCAGGVRYFGQRYRMIGCDLSHSALKTLDFYEQRVQANAAECIALPDSSVDAVVSSFFWEHIPPEVKPKILKECLRILKPDGKLIFLYDVETDNPLIRHFKKKDYSLYKALFIDGDGHVGYQLPQDNVCQFKQSGFSIVSHRGYEKTWVQSPSAYQKLSQFPSRAKMLLHLASRIGRQPFFYPYAALQRIVDTWVGLLLPGSWARVDLTVCSKLDPHNV